MKQVLFEQSAFDDFFDWGIYDKQKFIKIHDLIKDILRNPFSGLGKPEALKGDFRGYWSRRIDDKHRLIYKTTNDVVTIVSCKGHYGNK